MSVASTGAWTLERNDRRLDFATTPVATVFAESAGFRVTAHRHPAWKIVLPLGGHVEVSYGHTGLTGAADDAGGRSVLAAGSDGARAIAPAGSDGARAIASAGSDGARAIAPAGSDGARAIAPAGSGGVRVSAPAGFGDVRSVGGAGVIVAPQVVHSCSVSSAYVALLLEPWELAPADRPVSVDVAGARRILAALGHAGAGADLVAARAEIVGLAGVGVPLEPRVAYAVDAVVRDGSISAVAAEVGLSAPRLRALVRGSVGIPLARIRLWARLRCAVAVLPGGPAAVVAVSAGFADQAHLVRTARGLLGRTPSELFR
ncbi:AraC family transcriptional regulator [Winogradskya consettensis]|nr:AraC family transcriptional regulator [Actinoplanes consettensis]